MPHPCVVDEVSYLEVVINVLDYPHATSKKKEPATAQEDP
jgi:hypothetical protein